MNLVKDTTKDGFEDATSFVNVPQQHMNDCGVVVNELSRRLMINES